MLLIWGVESRHVRSFSLALTAALESALGSSEMTPESKETWYMVVQRLADTLLGAFGELRDGSTATVQRKSGNAWKKWSATLTHDTITLVSDVDVRSHASCSSHRFIPAYLPCFLIADQGRLSSSLLQKSRRHDVSVSLIETIEPHQAEDPSFPTPYCFALTSSGGSVRYYCVDSQVRCGTFF
jgi:hypothetical protein